MASTPEQKHARYMRHREAILAAERARRLANPAAWRAKSRAWYQRNRARRLETGRRWRARNRDRANELSREQARRNPEARLAIYRRYRESHRDQIRAIVRAHRARKAAAPGSHTLAEWRAKLAVYDYRCAYCGRSDVSLTEDHATPLARGGSDLIDNIVPACGSCNSRKRDLTAEEFREWGSWAAFGKLTAAHWEELADEQAEQRRIGV